MVNHLIVEKMIEEQQNNVLKKIGCVNVFIIKTCFKHVIFFIQNFCTMKLICTP